MEEIQIGNKKFNISCNASTYREYADKFTRNILSDLNKARCFINKQYSETQKLIKENPDLSKNEIEEKVFENTLDELDEFIECITKICWICIYDNNPQIEDYETWYKSLERLCLGDSWILEVLAVTAKCFL